MIDTPHCELCGHTAFVHLDKAEQPTDRACLALGCLCWEWRNDEPSQPFHARAGYPTADGMFDALERRHG